MSASLFYYKGYTLRDAEKNPMLCEWFDGLEERETYRGEKLCRDMICIHQAFIQPLLNMVVHRV